MMKPGGSFERLVRPSPSIIEVRSEVVPGG